MKKFLKRAGFVFGTLVVLLVIALVAIYFKSQARLSRVYEVPEETIAIPTSSASVPRGKHIFQFRGCEACHSGGGYLDLSASAQTLGSHLNLPSQDVPHM